MNKKKILIAQLGVIVEIIESKYAYFDSAALPNQSDEASKYKISSTHQATDTYVKKNDDKKGYCYPFLSYLETEKGEGFSDLILIGTEQSSWEKILSHLLPEKLHVIEKMPLKEIHTALRDFLKKKYSIEVEIVLVKNGITEREIEDNYNEIKKHMEEIVTKSKSSDSLMQNDENQKQDIAIRLDISNAFRSVPMLVFATTNYLSVLYRDYNFRLEVCCSVLESKLELVEENVQGYNIENEAQKKQAGQKEKKDSLNESKDFPKPVGVIPMVNITLVSEINQWTMAINEFYDNGSVVKLIQLIDGCKDRWFIGSVKKNDVIKDFEEFSFAINSNNLTIFIRAVKNIIEIKLDEKTVPSYVSDFVNYLVEDFKDRFGVVSERDDAKNSYFGKLTLEIARWYADQKRFGDAVIALQEGVVTYVIEKYYESVIELLKKREGIGEKEIRDLDRKKLLFDDGCRALISTLLFNYDEFDDFEEYYSKNKEQLYEDYGVLESDYKIWKEYFKKYDYICSNLRNPAMKVNYLSSDAYTDPFEIPPDYHAGIVEEAEDSINYCINMVLGEDTVINEKYFKCKFKYLLGITVNDFFISYRRKYNKDNDGRDRVLKLAEELRKSDSSFVVWTDAELERKASEKFTPEIRKAIRNSRFFIVLFGNNVFDRSLYKSESHEELDVFYEEIITAYKHFKKEADKHIIVVTFDEYSRSKGLEAVLFQEKENVICRYKEAEDYYDVLNKLITCEIQVHKCSNDNEEGVKKLVESILEIESIKQVRKERIKNE